MALDLKKLGATAARIGMRTAGNARVAITLHVGKSGAAMTIDPDTDQPVADPAGQAIATDARGGALLALRWEESVAKLQMQEGDSAAYSHTVGIEAAALPAGIAIDVMDWIESGGKRWEFLKVGIDPASALWIIHVRK